MLLMTSRLAVFAVLLSCFSLTSSAQAQHRLPPIPADKLTEAQKKATAEFEAARGTLGGPWAVMLRSPDMLNRR
jgi:4-carboxymuconolactone decarboxylase